ncbi:hypothetical protein NCAST_26_01100 [Nocardia asteroides NBRC 15531]|uniref:Uncharacterized protein n=1 Tax=Nocardia asteroides NBRC 15531 TaxID=1110697 RepID=U5E5R9_NOCAS|nr:hypothetical protein NCAST_26_01100 [Nocardia asteroides NBRC 15531]
MRGFGEASASWRRYGWSPEIGPTADGFVESTDPNRLYWVSATLDPDGLAGLGYRAPCLVVSPYSRGGLVASQTFDHSSQLRLLETRFGADVPNLTAWRHRRHDLHLVS